MERSEMISSAHLLWYMPTLLAVLLLQTKEWFWKGPLLTLLWLSLITMLIGGTYIHGMNLRNKGHTGILYGSAAIMAVIIGLSYM